MNNLEKFIWWIEERYSVYQLKSAKYHPPWSNDKTFQTTYFCNVHRENDRVTRWIREHYPVDNAHPEFNMMVARFVNKPSTLEAMFWPYKTWGVSTDQLNFKHHMSKSGAWGSAYIVSTNGLSLPKHEYIAGLLTAAWGHFEQVRQATTCLAAHKALQGHRGLASFMSAQIVADLKNTKGHPLETAEDWWTFVAPGPGSLRGMAWVYEYDKVSPTAFNVLIPKLRDYVDQHLSKEVPRFCNQDLQNCLCEFDKYMRVSTGVGRSKRKYAGA